MSTINFRLFSIAVLSILTTACAHVSQPYVVSPTNVETMKQIASDSASKVGVNNFTADKEVSASIMCRGEGPVSAPNNKSFAQYIKDAMVDELKAANLFDDGSDQKLSATLNKIDFSSALTGGSWDISMTFSANNVDPFAISIAYPFESSFVAYSACNQVAEALPRATQKLINELVKNPSFKKIIGSKK